MAAFLLPIRQAKGVMPRYRFHNGQITVEESVYSPIHQRDAEKYPGVVLICTSKLTQPNKKRKRSNNHVNK